MWSFAKELCDWPCSFLVSQGSKVSALQHDELFRRAADDFATWGAFLLRKYVMH